jgi:hypothetical protein
MGASRSNPRWRVRPGGTLSGGGAATGSSSEKTPEAVAAGAGASAATSGAATGAAASLRRARIWSTSALVRASTRVSLTSIPLRPGAGSWVTLSTTPSPRINRVPSLSTSSKVSAVPSGLGARVAKKMVERVT